MSDKLYQDEAWLREQYLSNGMSAYEIANIVGLKSSSTIYRWLDRFSIKRRPSNVSIRVSAISSDSLARLKDKDWLEYHHIVLGEDRNTIASELSVHCATVGRWLVRHGIKRSVPRREYTDPIWLRSQYIDHKFSIKEIAEGIGVTSSTVYKYLKKFNIEIRSPVEGLHIVIRTPYMRKRRSIAARGSKNHEWKGGISFEPYCDKFTDELKESVRNDFNRMCFVCGSSENGKKLSVHHCDYNKGQGCGQRWSLVPLCTSCHAKTNKNRWYWFNRLANHWANNPDINFNLF